MMTRKRVIALLAVVGLVGSALLIPWTVVGGDDDMGKPSKDDDGPRFSRAGVWIGGDWTSEYLWKETASLCDPAGKKLTSRLRFVNLDPVDYPGADAVTDFVGKYVRTGKNTYDYTGIAYLTGPVGDVRNQVLYIGVMSGWGDLVDCNTWEYGGLYGAFLADQDVDGDGLPEPGQEPFMRIPFEGVAKRLPMVDVSGPWPEMQ
jgi:hypothetical protein